MIDYKLIGKYLFITILDGVMYYLIIEIEVIQCLIISLTVSILIYLSCLLHQRIQTHLSMHKNKHSTDYPLNISNTSKQKTNPFDFYWLTYFLIFLSYLYSYKMKDEVHFLIPLLIAIMALMLSYSQIISAGHIREFFSKIKNGDISKK